MYITLLAASGLLASIYTARAQTTLVGIASSNPDFSTLVAAVQAAGLVDTLSSPGPFTVFAPNNAAFAKLPAGTVETLLANPARVKEVLLYHVVPGRVRSTDLESGKVLTAQGAAATIDLSDGVKINEAAVIVPDLEAANGVIHVIDTVILPPGNIVEIAASNPDFSTLVTAVQAAGLVDMLSSSRAYTVFAPNNAAFAKLPPGTLEGLLADTNRLKQILMYHMVLKRVRSNELQSGKLFTFQGAAANIDLENGVKINEASVVSADIEAGNGVIHVIDSVILPPPGILELALANADFSTLVTAVQAAGLVETLKAAGPYTVFAPNNAAFAKLPAGTLEALLQDTNRLRHILLYHLVHGPRIRAADLKTGLVSTLHGGPAKINVGMEGAAINQAEIIAVDTEALNGVIHVIDEVILPGDGFDNLSLALTVKNGQATLVWPVINGQIQVLESTIDPSGSEWSAINEPTTVSDGVNKVTIPASQPYQFFRIRTVSE